MRTSIRNTDPGPLLCSLPALLMFLAAACDARASHGEPPGERPATQAVQSRGLDPCVEGSWEPVDLEAFYVQVLAAEQEAEEEWDDPELGIEAFQIRGTIVYTFLPGGRAEVRYDASLTMESGDVSSGSRIVGTMRSTWQVEGGVLRLGPADLSDLRMAMQIGGQDISEPEPVPDDYAWYEREHGSAYRVTCRGDEMTLEMTEPYQIPEARLRRVR